MTTQTATTTMTETEIEREQLQCLFGEELHSEPWHETLPGPRYWFDGLPGWMGPWEVTPELHSAGVEYRTAITNELYGKEPTPDSWERVAHFTHSGERECYCEGSEPECPLCEGDGLIYLGEGWREVVYRLVHPRVWFSYDTVTHESAEHADVADRGVYCLDTDTEWSTEGESVEYLRETADSEATEVDLWDLDEDLLPEGDNVPLKARAIALFLLYEGFELDRYCCGTVPYRSEELCWQPGDRRTIYAHPSDDSEAGRAVWATACQLIRARNAYAVLATV